MNWCRMKGEEGWEIPKFKIQNSSLRENSKSRLLSVACWQLWIVRADVWRTGQLGRWQNNVCKMMWGLGERG